MKKTTLIGLILTLSTNYSMAQLPNKFTHEVKFQGENPQAKLKRRARIDDIRHMDVSYCDTGLNKGIESVNLYRGEEEMDSRELYMDLSDRINGPCSKFELEVDAPYIKKHYHLVVRDIDGNETISNTITSGIGLEELTHECKRDYEDDKAQRACFDKEAYPPLVSLYYKDDKLGGNTYDHGFNAGVESVELFLNGDLIEHYYQGESITSGIDKSTFPDTYSFKVLPIEIPRKKTGTDEYRLVTIDIDGNEVSQTITLNFTE